MTPQIQHFIRPTSSRPPSMVSVTIVSALVGLATGAAGFSLLKAWYPVDTYINGSVSGNNTVTIKTEQSLAAAVAAISTQVFAVYQGSATDNGALSQWRSDKEYLGSAVPVTSDGWLMVAPGVVISSPAEVIMNQKAYSVIDRYTDTFTGLVFIKIQATNLHPIQFVKADQVGTGSTLVYQRMNVGGISLFNRTLVTSSNQIDSSTKNSQVHSTDAMDSWVTVSDNSLTSDVVFTPDGSVAGVGYAPGKVMKSRFVQTAVDKLLTRATYVSLGFNYLDLYRLPEAQSNDKPSIGVLVYSAQRSAVTPGSIAQKSGLRSGDIILAIGGEPINMEASLMELLVAKKTGEVVTMKIERQGQEQELSFQL